VARNTVIQLIDYQQFFGIAPQTHEEKRLKNGIQHSQSGANNGAPYNKSGAAAGKYAPPPANSNAAKAGNRPGKLRYNALPGRYGMSRHDEWIDVTWALLNSSEFVYRH